MGSVYIDTACQDPHMKLLALTINLKNSHSLRGEDLIWWNILNVGFQYILCASQVRSTSE